VFVRLGKMFVVVALVATLGAHWALLQTVAWTTMLADNLQSCSFRDAVVKTFDGQHPCCLCKAIATAKKSENKNELTSQAQRLEFPLTKEEFAFVPPSQFCLMPAANDIAGLLPQKPPTPPPRGSFA